MAENLQKPQAIPNPFAWNGSRSTIPAVPVSENSNKANFETGFPPITSLPVGSGGIPPGRDDMNGLGYLYTSYMFFLQNGGVETFRPEVAEAIGGYPLNARLWGVDSDGNAFRVRSAKSANMDNFISNPSFIGTSWIVDISMSLQKRYVVETWRNADNSRWWAKYSDGYCEQGGFDMCGSGSLWNKTIPLLIQLSGNPLDLSITQTEAPAAEGNSMSIRIVEAGQTQNAFLTVRYPQAFSNIFWEVKGYAL